ncbi:hypothetical protein BH23PLA1_BH23PLA1_06620 [soil metagenome]
MTRHTASRTASPRRVLRPWVLCRLLPTTPAEPAGVHPILLALWFGMATGLLELGLLLATKGLHDPSPGLFRMNRHVLWVIPAFNLAAFATCGLLLLAMSRWRPGLASRLGPTPWVFLSALTLLLTIKKFYLIACLLLAAGIAYRLGGRLRSRPDGLRTGLRYSFPLLVGGVICLFALAIDREVLAPRRALANLPSAVPEAPNVLLIVLDTVRADHMSLHGYDRDTTPNLVRLAERGIRFDRAIAPSPWTLPSHATMFTGQWPFEHRAGLERPLDETHPTLAEHLAEHGYATAGFIANTAYCTAESGLARGFSHYEDHDLSLSALVRETALGDRVLTPLLTAFRRISAAIEDPNGLARGGGKATKDADRVHADFLAWLADRRPTDRPFFAFLNVFDAHHPYLLPDEGSAPCRFGHRPEARDDYLLLHRWWSIDKQALPQDRVALARDAYDDCLAYLDASLGQLFDELDQRGVLKETLVIVTSDHGELFGEHGVFGHGASLYQGEIHVPLLILPPERSPQARAGGQAVAEAVSLRDLPLTVLDLLGLNDDDAPPFPGTSLFVTWEPSTEGPRRKASPVLSEIEGPARYSANQGRSPASIQRSLRALIEDKLVYIQGGDGQEELYDLAADPAESVDLSKTEAARADLKRLRETLQEIVGSTLDSKTTGLQKPPRKAQVPARDGRF